MDLTDLDRMAILGLPWWEDTRPALQRFPDCFREGLPVTEAGAELVWRLSLQPAGARLSFTTDARTLRMTFRFPLDARMWNMSDEGQRGIDLWVDGIYWRCFAPFGQEEATFTCWDGLPAVPRNVTLVLPIYAPVAFRACIIEPDDATFAPWRPDFALDKPLVFYGTSITQGGCASRPSNTWPAVLARLLNLDHVNLALSGAARGEPEIAVLVADVEACAYIMDWGVNSKTWQEMAERYGPFLDIIRERRPEAPIICCPPIYSSTEAFSADLRLANIRSHIAGLARDDLTWVVDGYSLLGPADADGLADKTHVNDYGFRLMAERLAPVVRQALTL